MQAHQQMQVRGHDTELEYPRPLLPSNNGEMLPEVLGTGPIYGRLTIAGGLDDMDQELMMHTSGSTHLSIAAVPFQRTAGRFSDLSRAVASATSAGGDPENHGA